MAKKTIEPTPAAPAAMPIAAMAQPKKGAPKTAAQPKASAKTAKSAKEKQLSALDAAARVLGEAKQPMTSREMIEMMSEKGYWTSPNGQTPEATLYAAIIREVRDKGKASRFAKSERGKFERTKVG